MDAKLTSDGQIVVVHDQSIDRTTAETGKVAELTLDQIRQLDAGSAFDPRFRGEPIPTLNEVFEAVGKLTYTNIELTNYGSYLTLTGKVGEPAIKHNLAERVLFSSFNPFALIRIHRILQCSSWSAGNKWTIRLVGSLLDW